MQKRRVAVVTGTRAEYGIWQPILQALHDAPDFDLRLIVSGMHLLPEYGYTIEEIQKDGYPIGATVDFLLQSNTPSGMARSLGVALLGMTQALEQLRPDFVFVLGDRGEMLAAAIAAAHMKQLVVHFHGGEVSGSIDESIRHAITKFAHLHLVATEQSARRVRQLGEESWRIHVVGAPRIETIKRAKLPPYAEVKRQLNLPFDPPYLLLVYHPVVTEIEAVGEQIQTVLSAVKRFGLPTVIIGPNSDAGSHEIFAAYAPYRNRNDTVFIVNVPHLLYLSLLKHAAVLVGNSSSGIIEAPSLGVPVVNIGSRQQGRERAANVLDVPCKADAIAEAIERALTDEEFRQRCRTCQNPYGQGDTSKRVLEILRNLSLEQYPWFQKRFVDGERCRDEA